MKWSYTGDVRKILVQTEQTRVVFKSDCSDQSIYRRQTYAFRPGQPRNRGCLTVSGETTRLQHIPQGKKALNAMDISSEPLQYLRHDDAGESEGFGFLNHSPQFTTGAARRKTEKFNPDGRVD